MSPPLPKNINPCPIIDANIEIRFSTDVEPDAVFGLIYREVRGDYADIEKLPILQIPEKIRNEDPNFQYKATHRLKNDIFTMQIGPRTIAVGAGSGRDYPGWLVINEEIERRLQNMDKIDLKPVITRVGVRYIDFFEDDIFDNIKLKITANGTQVSNEQCLIRLEFVEGELLQALQIANHVEIQDDSKSRQGSAVDIDTYIEADLGQSFSKQSVWIEKGHALQKERFFGLLTDGFLKSLNPEY